MKKLYPLILFSSFLFAGEKSFSQSFAFVNPDTSTCGTPGTTIDCLGDSIVNNTAINDTLYVVRVQDDTGTPGWVSTFCLDVCYLPTKDSVRFILAPYKHQNLLIHFNTSSTPDCGTVLFKVKDKNSSAVAYQRYYGYTTTTCVCLNGVNELFANSSNVSVYPSPLVANDDFNMNITNMQNGNKEISLLVYNIYGSMVSRINNLKEGNNTLNFNLPAGIYSYSLISDNTPINSGKIEVIK